MTTWRKSSYSANGGATCVEVRPGPMVGVRDSKARNRGRLDVAPVTWRRFVAGVRAGRP